MRTTSLLCVLMVALATATSATLCPGGDSALLHVQSGNCSYRELSFESAAVPFCMVAYKVATARNTLVFTPISTTNYTFSGPYGYQGFVDCRTASGKARVLDPSKPKQATLQLWRDWTRESVVKAISSSVVEITTYDVPLFRTAPINCRFQYKVTSGCLLGAKAPTVQPVTCPAGNARKKGRGGYLYCEPCRFGFYAAANAASCTACPVEAKLGTLPAGLRPQCPSCLVSGYCYNGCEGDNMYKDPVKGCTKCPAGSSLTATQDGCAKCVEGRRCCVRNPSAACPACPAGFKAQDTSFTIVATGVKGLPWQRCRYSSVYQCFQRTRVTVHANCSISTQPSNPTDSAAFMYELDGVPQPPQPAQPTSGSSVLTCDAVAAMGLLYGSDAINNAGTFNLGRDVLAKIFKADYNLHPTKALFRPVGSYFEVSYTGTTCQPRFRVVEATHPAILAPLTLLSTCPAAAAECKKPCPAGSYVTKFAGGPSACLPCPPATYSTAPNSASCKRCPPGQAAFGVGNTRCRICPAGTTSRGGSICEKCYNAWAPPGSSSGACSPCPEGTTGVASGCITKYGPSPCCYVGTCGPFPPCNATDPIPASARVGALLQLASASPSCNTAPLIGCMSENGLMYASSYDESGYLALSLLGGSRTGPLCGQRYAVEAAYGIHDGPQAFTFVSRLNTPGPWALDGNTFYGTATATTKPLGLALTIYQTGAAIGATAAPTVCTATLQLVNGVLLGMKKQRTASCPPGLFPKTYGGVNTCESCGDAKKFYGGQCMACHPGTFNYEPDRTYCTTCPVGTYSPGEGYSECYACGAGSAPNPQHTNCGSCPVNTYAPLYAASCKPCAAGTTTRNNTNAGFCWF